MERNVLPTSTQRNKEKRKVNKAGLMLLISWLYIPELIQFSVTCKDVSEVEGHPSRRDLDEEVPLVRGKDRGDPTQDAALTALHVRADLPRQPVGQVHA